MSGEIDPSLMQDFLAESSELVEQLDADLVRLESAAAEDEARDLLNSIFRALHTVKGAASFLALDEVTGFAHVAEDALNRLRKGEAQVTPAVIDALLQSADVLRLMVEALGAGDAAPPCPSDLLERLRAIADADAVSGDGAVESGEDGEDDDESALTLSPAKQALVGDFAADLREGAGQLRDILEHAKDPAHRGSASQELCELAEAMGRTAAFFELANLVAWVQVIGEAGAKLEAVAEPCAGPLLVRLMALASLIERSAAALEQGRTADWPTDTLIERIAMLTSSSSLPGELAGDVDTDVEQVLALDGVMPTKDPSIDGQTMQDGAAADADAAAADDVAAGAVPGPDDRRLEDRRQGDRRASGDQTIRVEVSRLEALLNLVGQMVLAKNRVLGLTRRLQEQSLPPEMMEEAVGAANDLDRLMGSLQVGVMRTRMQPLAKLFDRYPRVIRDVARATDKQIHLEITGKETEVDKSVLELLADPLVHILRNSADHGIESPHVRREKGKSETGVIQLSAQHQGSHIRVTIRDDGKGIDPEVIGRKAVEKGLVTSDQLASMSNQDIFGFIFAAGFSTAEKVSDLSGRGVGMDVVRTNVQKMNGTIHVDSTPGEGATIEILIPLTVAIMPAMVVGVGPQSYCVPLQSIVEIVRPQVTQSVNGAPTMRLRDDVLPLIDLRQRLGSDALQAARFALVVGAGSQRAGLLVDRLIGQQDIVIKPLDDNFAQGGPFSGATIQENGEVSLIVDVVQLLRHNPEPHTPGRQAA